MGRGAQGRPRLRSQSRLQVPSWGRMEMGGCWVTLAVPTRPLQARPLPPGTTKDLGSCFQERTPCLEEKLGAKTGKPQDTLSPVPCLARTPCG